MTITYIPAKRTTERQYKPTKFHIKLTEKRRKAIKKTAIFITSNLFSLTPILASTTSSLSAVDVGGQKLFEMLIHLGYWVAVIGCSIALIKKVKDGDIGSIMGTVLKFVILYASLFGIRIFLDVVNETFGVASGMSLPTSGFNLFKEEAGKAAASKVTDVTPFELSIQ